MKWKFWCIVPNDPIISLINLKQCLDWYWKPLLIYCYWERSGQFGEGLCGFVESLICCIGYLDVKQIIANNDSNKYCRQSSDFFLVVFIIDIDNKIELRWWVAVSFLPQIQIIVLWKIINLVDPSIWSDNYWKRQWKLWNFTLYRQMQEVLGLPNWYRSWCKLCNMIK